MWGDCESSVVSPLLSDFVAVHALQVERFTPLGGSSKKVAPWQGCSRRGGWSCFKLSQVIAQSSNSSVK